MLNKVSLSILTFSVFYSLVSLLSVTSVYALDGRCCYDPSKGETKCSADEACYTDRQVKNDCNGNGPEAPGGCHLCVSPKVATACTVAGTGETNACSITPNPSSVKVSVGESKIVSSTFKPANGSGFLPWDTFQVNYRSSSTSVFTDTPYVTTVAPYNTNVKGLAVSPSASMSITGGIYTNAALKYSCRASIGVSVVAPLACEVGVKCEVVGGGSLVKGAKMNCVLPLPTVPSEYLSQTLTYEAKCDVYNGSTLTKASALSLTSNVNGFQDMSIDYTGTYKCMFRHCFTSADTRVCSTWGV